MKNSFEDWKEAGVQYASDHPELEMWEFQIRNMARDFAWRMEGMEITPQSVEYAYKDWISGNNPYSVHTILLDGYDREESWRRRTAIATEKYTQYALDHGIEPRNLERFMSSACVELYFDKDSADRSLKEWFSGKAKESPHHIPLNPEHLRDREERKAYVKTLFPLIGDGLIWRLFLSRSDVLAPSIDLYKYYDRRYVQGIPLEILALDEME